VILSHKYGVNPTMPVCFYCQHETGEVALLGRVVDKKTGKEVEAPRHMILDHTPCDACKEWMEKGVILISVKNSTTSGDDPLRTGGWCVVKDEALARFITPPALLMDMLKKRVAFVSDELWDKIGLPRENVDPKPA
jgi:hypothetical protein